MAYKILLLIGVVFNVIAQILLKTGMGGLNILETNRNIVGKLQLMFINSLFWGSVLCYAIGFLIYSVVLSKIELSIAYPVASIAAIILIFIISVLYLAETINITKIFGIIFCILGILMLFK